MGILILVLGGIVGSIIMFLAFGFWGGGNKVLFTAILMTVVGLWMAVRGYGFPYP
jgi:hypothetical protein